MSKQLASKDPYSDRNLREHLALGYNNTRFRRLLSVPYELRRVLARELSK